MFNPLLYCQYQCFLRLLDPNVEFPVYFLSRNDWVYGLWLHRLDLRVLNAYARNEFLCHRLLHKHIYNAAHDYVSFKIVNFCSPCNITDFTSFLLLLSLYQRQSNQQRIPFCFTCHSNVSTSSNLVVCRNSWIKIYYSYVSFEENEHILLEIPSFRFSSYGSSEAGIPVYFYFIWTNEWMILACPKPEYFIEKKDPIPSIIISVRRQSNPNLHILHWVVTWTKRVHTTIFHRQFIQPKICPSTQHISLILQLSTCLRLHICALLNVCHADILPYRLFGIPPRPSGLWGYAYLNGV